MPNFWDQDALIPTPPPKGSRSKKDRVSAEQASGDMMELPKSRDNARKELDMLNRLAPQIDRAWDVYEKQLKGAGTIKSLREYLPSQGNAEVDRAFGQLRTLVRPATRTPGEGSTSDFESKLALQSTPDRYSFDASNEEAFKGLRRFVDVGRANATKRLGLPTPPPGVGRKAPAREYTIDRNGNLVR